MESAKSWQWTSPYDPHRDSSLDADLPVFSSPAQDEFDLHMDVLVYQLFEMPLIGHDHVVEQVSSAATNPSLSNAVLTRTSEAGPFGLYAEAFHRIDHLFIEVRCAVDDQVVRNRVVGKGLTQLLDNPRAGQVPGDAAAQDSAPIMRDHEEAAQHSKGQRRHGKEIHCSNGFAVIAQKLLDSGQPSNLHSDNTTHRLLLKE